MALRMRQSLAEFEAAFREETVEERLRRERLRKEAAERSRVRRAQRVEKRGNMNFKVLVLVIIATTVVVTFAMFQTLSLLIGG
ncbi:MAG TPA: hypothetical protein VFL87_09730 [Thermoleophilaceae bacterium]|jgi:hypothetical protein|nr:hypothetical protein [Thermoleophilaceae bacterium]